MFKLVSNEVNFSDKDSAIKLGAIINIRKVKNYDMLIISSPPLFTGIIGLYAKFFLRNNYWLDLRDLWPDSALELGQLKRGILYKLGKNRILLIFRRRFSLTTSKDRTFRSTQACSGTCSMH